MLWALLAKGGMQQGQQAAPGVQADPFGSFSHFMGSATANAFDPFNSAGHSGNNPVKNFLNPGGATLINGMTPSNNPLPINPNGTPDPALDYSPMQTGISQPQMGQMDAAYTNFLRNLGMGGQAGAFMNQQRPPAPGPAPSLMSGGGMGMGGMSPAHMQQLLQLGGQRRPM